MDAQPLVMEAPEMRCAKCGATVPDNRQREIAIASARKGRDLTPDELENLPHNKMALLACEACAIAALPPKPRQRLRAISDQMQLNVPSIFIT